MKTKKQKSLGVSSDFSTPYLKIVDVRDDKFLPIPNKSTRLFSNFFCSKKYEKHKKH